MWVADVSSELNNFYESLFSMHLMILLTWMDNVTLQEKLVVLFDINAEASFVVCIGYNLVTT